MQLKSLKFMLSAVLLSLMAFANGPAKAIGDDCTPPVVVDKKLTGNITMPSYTSTGVVCFDDGNGDCDSTLPSTTVGSSGSYSLVLTSDVAGRQVNAIIKTTNFTGSGMGGGSFSPTITLAAIVSGDKQNITPLTTALIAQIKIRKTPAEALQAIRVMTGSAALDVNSDNFDPKANLTANKIMDRLNGTARNSVLSWVQGLAILNAFVSSNYDIVEYRHGEYTQPVFSAQLAYPAFSKSVNAASILAEPKYMVHGDLLLNGQEWNSPANQYAPVRESYTLSGATVNPTQEVQSGTTWSAVTPVGFLDSRTKGDPWLNSMRGAAIVMKSDGTWTNKPLSWDQLHPSYNNLVSSGSSMVGVDSITGDEVTIKYRTFDASGFTFSAAPQKEGRKDQSSNLLAALDGVFPQGTAGYLMTVARSNDQLALITYGVMGGYENGYMQTGETIDGTYIIQLGNQGVSHTSVMDVVGMKTAFGMCYDITFLPDNTAVIDWGNYPICGAKNSPITFPLKTTWSVYSRNDQVIVLDIPKEYLKTAAYGVDPVSEAVSNGWSFIVGLKYGRLMSGFLKPAKPETYMLFSAEAVDKVAAAMRIAGPKVNRPQKP